MDGPTPILDEELRAEAECRLTTVGRSSGQPRQVALWFAAVGDRLFLLAGGREAAQANPAVKVRIRRRAFDGSARVIEGTPDDPIARDAMAAKFGTTYLTRWLRESLPVVVDIKQELPQ
jgi:deazaflavin-dependent oxidoreductase (nitroreductase family)